MERSLKKQLLGYLGLLELLSWAAFIGFWLSGAPYLATPDPIGGRIMALNVPEFLHFLISGLTLTSSAILVLSILGFFLVGVSIIAIYIIEKIFGKEE